MNEKITFNESLSGYYLDANSRKLSPHTIADYTNTFKKLMNFFDEDILVSELTVNYLKFFLSSQEVSNKTIKNYHTGLSAYFTWAVSEGIVDDHLMRHIKPPKPEEKAIDDLTQEQIKALLSVIDKSKEYDRPGKVTSSHTIATADRNRTILYILLDTGLRVSELCSITINHCDLQTRRIKVMGKGAKERIVPFGARTGKLIWKYLHTYRSDARLNETLLVTKDGFPVSRRNALDIFEYMGERAGVSNVHPHRFRHTFAINFLRNGGNQATLQRILGHSTPYMTNRYLKIAERDIDAGHRIASPVDNWRL